MNSEIKFIAKINIESVMIKYMIILVKKKNELNYFM